MLGQEKKSLFRLLDRERTRRENEAREFRESLVRALKPVDLPTNMTTADNVKFDNGDWLTGFTRSDRNPTRKELNSDWIFRSCDLRSHGFAVNPWHLEDKRTSKPVENHVMYDLYEYVNQDMTEYDLWYTTQYQIDLYDDSYHFIELNGLGKPEAIYVLWPGYGQMKVHKDAYGTLLGYSWTVGGKSFVFEPNEIVHHKAPSVTQGTYGELGLMSMVFNYASIDRKQKLFGAATFDNQAAPSLVLGIDGMLSDNQFTRLKDQIKEDKAGVRNARKVWVVENGRRIERTTFTQQELDYINGLNLTRDHILQIAGISRIVANIDSTTRADAEQGDYQFDKRTIFPICKRRDFKMTQDFCQRYYDKNLVFVSDNPVGKDKLKEAQIRSHQLSNGQATLNQFAVEDGRPLLPPEQGDVYFVPAGLVPVGEAVRERNQQGV